MGVCDCKHDECMIKEAIQDTLWQLTTLQGPYIWQEKINQGRQFVTQTTAVCGKPGIRKNINDFLEILEKREAGIGPFLKKER